MNISTFTIHCSTPKNEFKCYFEDGKSNIVIVANYSCTVCCAQHLNIVILRYHFHNQFKIGKVKCLGLGPKPQTLFKTLLHQYIIYRMVHIMR